MDYYTLFARQIYPLNSFRSPTLPGPHSRYKASPAQARVPFIVNAPSATANAQKMNQSRLAAIVQGYRTSSFNVNVFGPSVNVPGGNPPTPSQTPSTPTSFPKASSTNVWNRPFSSIHCGPGAEVFFSQENRPSPHEPAELSVKIGGPRGFLDWNIIRPEVNRFLEYRSNATSNTLNVDWGTSNADKEGWRGRNTLKHLFRLLNDTRFLDGKVYRPTGSFKCISVTVPAMVHDIESCDSLGNRTTEDDSIDLQHAMRLDTFLWKGDFSVLVKKFVNIPFGRITILKICGCVMSVDDALSILHSGPNLATVELDAVDNETANKRNLGSFVKGCPVSQMWFNDLEYLKIVSHEPISQLLDQIRWNRLQILDITWGARGQVGIVDTLLNLPDRVQGFHLSGRLESHHLKDIKDQLPHAVYQPDR